MKKELQDFKNQTFIEIEYDEKNGWIHNKWSGIITMNDVKKGALACLEILEEKKAKAIINDNTQLLTKWDGANEWIANEWMPRAIKAGLKSFAHIVNPVHQIGETSAKGMKEKSRSKFQMEIFHDFKSAEEWVKKEE